MMSFRVPLFAIAALAALPAAAQQNYVVTSVSQTYTALSNATVVSVACTGGQTTNCMTNGGGGVTVKDEGYVSISLGFTFPYFGNNYTSVGINSNGILLFGTAANSECDYSNGGTVICTWGGGIPSTFRTPHNVIAPWWNDLDGNANGEIRYVKPNASEIVIEFFDWQQYSTTGSFSFQVRLNASGLFQIHYGSYSGSFWGTVGFENDTGSQGAAHLSCGTTGSCSYSNWPSNTLYTIGQPVQADLFVEEVLLANMVKTGSDLSFDVSPKFRNFGQTAANTFHWKAYLSTDRYFDTNDQLIYDSSVSGNTVSVPGVGVGNTPTATATGAALATNVVTEFSESNNVGSTANYFTFGIDLVATAVIGPAVAIAGEPVTVQVDWFNQGTDPAGSVDYQILLSADQTFDANDFVAYTGTKTVTGGQTISEQVAFTLSQHSPGGKYFWGLRIDPTNAVAEASETNNTAFGSVNATVHQADLEIVSVDLVDAKMMQPVRIAYFGEAARMVVNFNNTGGASARNFKIGVVISRDSNLSLLNDTQVTHHSVALVPAYSQAQEVIDFTVPAVDKDGKTFVTGSYFLFAVLDSWADVTELSEFNNLRPVGAGAPEPVQLREIAADYSVISVTAPSLAAVGEVVPVTRAFRNVGNDAGGPVSYRFYASANEIVTTDDIHLPIFSGGTLKNEGTVQLGRGEGDTATDLVLLPSAVVPGNWYIGAIVDSGGAEEELLETNNARASRAQTQIVQGSMQITVQQLPDGLVGAPYTFQLGVSGALGPVTWSSAEALPEGLGLNNAGLISGTPMASGIVPFTVVAQAGMRVATARLVIRVVPPSGELFIASATLPPVINSPTIQYSSDLSAAGGVRPYTWALESGALPNGITLKPEGILMGAVRSGVTEGEYPIVLRVQDALGARARGQFKLRVVQPGALLITSMAVPDTMVHEEYFTDLAAANANGSPLAKPLLWSLIGGRLPAGLTLSTVEESLGLVTGKAVEAGTFTFTVQVMDAKGRSDVADFVLKVHPRRLEITPVNLPSEVHPGDEVSFVFTTGSNLSRFRIFSGALPPGLSLNADGTVSGTVEMENSVGTWNYVVEAESATAGVSLRAFSMEVTPAPETGGCAAAPGGLGALGWLAPLALALRRRKGIALAAVAAVALAGLPAQAQSSGFTYVVNGPYPYTYQTLQGATTVTGLSQWGMAVPIPLPFDFEFYGNEYSSIAVQMHGYAEFGNGTYSYSYNYGIPHSYSWMPTRLVAPWWDELNMTTGSAVKYKTEGTAPNRIFSLEWLNMCNSWSCGTTKFTFRVELHEKANRIRFVYGGGTASGSAAVGIMDSVGVGKAVLSCTTASSGNCNSSSFPTNSYYEIAVPADVILTNISSDDTAYAGVPIPATATIKNIGGLKALGAKAAFYLSTDTVLDASDVKLGDTNSVDPDVEESLYASGTLTVPNGTVPGEYFLIGMVDPPDSTGQDSIDEGAGEGNNISAATLFYVGPPTPDLQVTVVSGPETANKEQLIGVNRTVLNGGNADATAATQLTWFVSDNSVVTVSDVVMATVSVSPLAAGTSEPIVDEQVQLPAGLPAGRYWIGACADYDPAAQTPGTLAEISEVNNCTTGTSFILNTGALAIVTTSVPTATQNSPYGLRLQAIGGDGSYTWSLDSGTLPPGMSLSAQGDLTGTPFDAGAWTFTAKVASAGSEVTHPFTMTVTARDLPLAVVDQVLPTAEFGRGYQWQLVAVGGNPPYLWALKQDSRLPEGLGMSPDGFIEGRASQTSNEPFPFTVVVKDASGASAAKDLQIRVVKPASMHIATTKLVQAYLKKEYRQPLSAIGGAAPYRWSVVRFQRLAQTATELPGEELPSIPENFGILVQKEGDQAVLRGMPTQAGLYALTLYVQDRDGASDTTTLTLNISYDLALAITTTVLPDAFVNQPYTVRLSHNAGSGVTVDFAEACVQQVESTSKGYVYKCVPVDPLQKLPGGLLLGNDGTISGAPTAPVGQEAVEPGVEPPPVIHSFLVKATDSSGRIDVRSLSIKIRTPPVEKTGCSGTGLGPAALALLGLAGLARRRRS